MKKNPPRQNANISKPDPYKTTNIYEAAFLATLDFHLIGKEKAGIKTVLIFSGEGIEDAVLKFYDNGMVKARAYAESYKRLKDFIFASH